jgi:uncharacterized membrane protein
VFLAGVLTVAVRYPDLPAIIATHFTTNGTADEFGPRSTVLWLPAIWLVLQAGIAVLSRYPRIFNYLVPITADNAQRLYREGERVMVGLGAGMAVTFFGAVLTVLDGASTGRMVLGAGVGVMVVTCAVGIVRMLR